MKKSVISFVLSMIAALTIPAVANAQAPAAAPATTTTITTTAAPAATAPATAMTATTSEKLVELKDGSLAKVSADGTVKVSTDGGKTWTPAPDGTWGSKDGMTTLNVKGGKQQM